MQSVEPSLCGKQFPVGVISMPVGNGGSSGGSGLCGNGTAAPSSTSISNLVIWSLGSVTSARPVRVWVLAPFSFTDPTRKAEVGSPSAGLDPRLPKPEVQDAEPFHVDGHGDLLRLIKGVEFVRTPPAVADCRSGCLEGN